MVDMSLLTRLWLLTHHVFSSTQTNRGAITNGDRGITARPIGNERFACQNALPSMDPARLGITSVLIPVPRGVKTCIHRRTFISSTK